MLTKRIIPCLDVKDGRVVKGINFVNLIDAGDPVECAKAYSDLNADELVFLDITATSDDRKTIVDVIRNVAKNVFIPLTVGGGIKTTDDMRELLMAGADKVSINSSAVNNPDLINEAAEIFGNQCIVVAIDARQEVYRGEGLSSSPVAAVIGVKQEVVSSINAKREVVASIDAKRDVVASIDAKQEVGAVIDAKRDVVASIDAKQEVGAVIDCPKTGSSEDYKPLYKVYTHGGRVRTDLDVIEWAKEVEKRGAGEILLTSMDKDGTKSGFDIELTKRVCEAVNIPVIASGGAGKKEDFKDILQYADAALAASLFHFNEVSIKELKKYLYCNKIPTRLIA